jgi:hypothetical protein
LPVWMCLTMRTGQSLSRRTPDSQEQLLHQICIAEVGVTYFMTPWNHICTGKFVICALTTISLTYEIISSWYHRCRTMISSSYMVSYMISIMISSDRGYDIIDLWYHKFLIS